MKPNQILPRHLVHETQCRQSASLKCGRLFSAGWLLVLVAVLCLSSKSWGQVYTATNHWTGLGGEPLWPVAGNWTNSVVPVPTSLVILTNYGSSGLPGTNGSGAVGAPNIIVSNDTSIASLWIVNTNLTGANGGFHTLQISNGVTLTISNSIGVGQTNILMVTSQSGAAGHWGVDYGAQQPIYGTIQGAGGKLVVIATNGLGSAYTRGNIFVSQGTLGGPLTTDLVNATLDLSGLDEFSCDANHICVAADPGPAPFFYNRPNGTLYLAKTNRIVLWAAGNHQSASLVNQGILAGMLAQNNGGPTPTRMGRIYLGLTNAIFCNTGIGLGIRTCSGWLGFNPSNAPGTSYAYFRDRAGTGRQSTWAIGNRLNASSVQNISGELDFSLGKVDALVGTLGIAVSPVANTEIGTVSFGNGTIDVNVLQCGYQSVAGGGGAQGTLNVSNTAVLKVNSSAVLGGMAGTPVSGNTYFGRINITDGGTVQFLPPAAVTCGIGSASEIRALAGTLQVFSLGTPAAPLTTLQLASATLTVDRGVQSNPNFPIVSVQDLDLSGVNTINVYGTVLVAGQFPLIKYSAIINGSFANLTLGAASPGLIATLVNNVANSSIDLLITASPTSVIAWDGQTNGVDVSLWDIATTPNWQGVKTYLQPGSLVQFDDTATGTTTVNLTTTLQPPTILITNNAKTYTFNGLGLLSGPGNFAKDGSGTLIIANTGANTLTGDALINSGTVQLSGSANRLPTNWLLTFQDVAGAKLDLNGVNQTLGGLTGGGTAGGEIALGSGTLTIPGITGVFPTYAGTISGTGTLIRNGSSIQKLTGASTYSGGTYLTNSSLIVANASGSGLGSGPVVVSTNGLLQIGDGTVDGGVAYPFLTNNNGTITLFPATDYTLTNIIYGSGSLVKAIGNGTTTSITNENFHRGSTLVQQGVLLVSHPRGAGAGTITVGNATATDTYLGLAGDIAVTNAIVLSGKTGAIVPSPVGLNNVSGTNAVTGPITITGSTCWSIGAADGKLTVNGPVINSQAGTLCELFLRGGGEGDLRANLTNPATLKLMLTKTDAGQWTLTGTNTINGRTAINGGKLVVNGALAGSSNVIVQSLATLAGTGFISGAVTNSGVIDLSGDDVLGSLTVSNALLTDSGAMIALDVSTNGNDRIRGLTTLVLDGTLKVVLSGTLPGNAIFKLFDATNYVGTFAGYDLPDISPLTWDTSQLAVDGTLRAAGGAYFTPAITGIAPGAGGSFSISGTGTIVAPFGILTSTNVALPLANWINLGGGTFSNGQFVFTDFSATNAPQRYYRLVTPSPW
jgi:autotransporter-associated beta strand protein